MNCLILHQLNKEVMKIVKAYKYNLHYNIYMSSTNINQEIDLCILKYINLSGMRDFNVENVSLPCAVGYVKKLLFAVAKVK